MKQLTVRAVRAELTRIDRVLAHQGEVLLTRRGKPVARLLPVRGAVRPVSHADLRRKMKPLAVGSEVYLRAERDER
jgi:antitoxin (DNA-binding transcriptional repressor) of toxin-antitoxin stability system